VPRLKRQISAGRLNSFKIIHSKYFFYAFAASPTLNALFM
jgi:hypothetical protein